MANKIKDDNYLVVLKKNACIEKYKSEILHTNTELKLIQDRLSNVAIDRYRGISRYPLYSENEGFDTLFHDLDYALETCKKAGNIYEVIKISLMEQNCDTENFLGFDVGYYGGDCFSALCDSIIMPQWHPIPSDCISTLLPHIRKLNHNLLYQNYKDALDYCNFYLKQEWSEKSMYENQFCVISVSLQFGEI
jgi:hypothetical protein